jgi:hypothetical protein
MVENGSQKLAIAGGIQQDVHPTLHEDTISTLAKYGRPTLEEDEVPPSRRSTSSTRKHSPHPSRRYKIHAAQSPISMYRRSQLA